MESVSSPSLVVKMGAPPPTVAAAPFISVQLRCKTRQSMRELDSQGAGFVLAVTMVGCRVMVLGSILCHIHRYTIDAVVAVVVVVLTFTHRHNTMQSVVAGQVPIALE